MLFDEAARAAAYAAEEARIDAIREKAHHFYMGMYETGIEDDFIRRVSLPTTTEQAVAAEGLYQSREKEYGEVSEEETATPPPPPMVRQSRPTSATETPAKSTASKNQDRQRELSATRQEKRPASTTLERDIQEIKIKKRSDATAAGQSTKASTAENSAPTPFVSSNAQRRQPAWYQNLSSTAAKRNVDKSMGGADVALLRLKDLIHKCKKPLPPQNQVVAYQEVRDRLHILAFEHVNEALVRSKRMLHDADGLPQIFDNKFAGNANWPWDIKADAEELYNRWAARQFDTYLFKGIVLGKPKKKQDGKLKTENLDSTTDKLEPGAVEKYKLMDTKTHGNGALLNGQWWPAQLCTMRDGAHGATISGISGKQGEGAFSVIIAGGNDGSGQPYPNVDNGDEILYCGTDSANGIPSEGTQRLSESAQNGKPIRLLRSHNLKNHFAPEIGFRYDGLYKVVETEMMDPLDSKRQRHRFKMVRLPGQDPVRGRSGPEKRPTKQEIEAYDKDQQLRGRRGG